MEYTPPDMPCQTDTAITGGVPLQTVELTGRLWPGDFYSQPFDGLRGVGRLYPSRKG